ncbi:MAG: Na/Pi cotransporter family protein [Woeseiaceae bacterium]
MLAKFDFWQFIGGIGLFLFAMAQLELALKSFAGRSLKTFLRNHTDRPLKSVAVGTVMTSLVQSSSLVGLMVLAFVGASIISLENALGVIFGANLGTTLTGWAVTLLGFKLDLESVALPLIGFGSLTLVGLKGRVAEFGRILAALGFLLMGLSLMKNSVGSLSEAMDVGRLASLAGWQYLLFGVVFAAVVQSSSAAMMVTLTALYSGVIELPAAAAVAIGADLGTTSTMLIGALRGSAGTKRVALAHVIFNVTTVVVAFSLLTPLLTLIRSVGISDPLLSLITFHSLFNFLGIVIFFPFMKPFAHFLEQQFGTAIEREGIYINETAATVPDAALAAIAEETVRIVARIVRQNMCVFSPALPTPPGQTSIALLIERGGDDLPFDEQYRKNKRLEGEILSFAVRVQEAPLEAEQSESLSRMLSSIRHAMNSAKSLRDIRHNLEELDDEPWQEAATYLEHFRSVMTEFYAEVYRLHTDGAIPPEFQDFAHLLNRIHDWHEELHRKIYAGIHEGQLQDHDISTLLNVNRELLNSNTALVLALQELSVADEEVAA